MLRLRRPHKCGDGIFLANQMLVLFFPIFISNLVKYANFAHKGLTKILRPLLYTNMTLTKP